MDPFAAWGKQIPLQERPRERLAFFGAQELHDEELITLVFGTGSTVLAARLLLQRAGGIYGLRKQSLSELCDLPGVGLARATQLKAALELGQRALRPEPLSSIVFRSPAEVAQLLRSEFFYQAQESMHVFGVDSHHRMCSRHLAAMGQSDQVLVSAMDVFHPLVKERVSGFLVVHNHPSGDPTPSEQDKIFTKQLVQGAQLLGLRFLDHLIVAGQGFFSFSEAGLL